MVLEVEKDGDQFETKMGFIEIFEISTLVRYPGVRYDEREEGTTYNSSVKKIRYSEQSRAVGDFSFG